MKKEDYKVKSADGEWENVSAYDPYMAINIFVDMSENYIKDDGSLPGWEYGNDAGRQYFVQDPSGNVTTFNVVCVRHVAKFSCNQVR